MSFLRTTKTYVSSQIDLSRYCCLSVVYISIKVYARSYKVIQRGLYSVGPKIFPELRKNLGPVHEQENF